MFGREMHHFEKGRKKQFIEVQVRRDARRGARSSTGGLTTEREEGKYMKASVMNPPPLSLTFIGNRPKQKRAARD